MSFITSGGRLRAFSSVGDMGASSRVLEKDEELGKRGDGYWRHSRNRSQAINGALPWRRNRIFAGLVTFVVVYLLFRNVISPATISRPSGLGSKDDGVAPTAQPIGPPPVNEDDRKNMVIRHYYSDTIRFYKLASTLQAAHRASGYTGIGRNVLFAASNLQSLAKIIPLACTMQRLERNDVHVALFGRDVLTLDQIKEINGVQGTGCSVNWHDARPDYAEYSTDERAETGATFALKSFNEYVEPQAIITDDLDLEDAFFKRSVLAHVDSFDDTVIQIYKGTEDQLGWLARVDGTALKRWHAVSVDILIHADHNTIGPLQRLLRSLLAADYRGLGYPRLTIELSTEVDAPTRSLLKELRWPPTADNPLSPTSLLTVRHRVNGKRLSGEEAAVRFVESYYPHHPRDAHVLVLSPDAELSPLYYHYVKYNILEYRYGSDNKGTSDVVGFSLELPTTLLDATTALRQPTTHVLSESNPFKAERGKTESPMPFLWAAPQSNAAVYFGDRWVELQSFVTNRIDRRKKHISKQKEVSTKYPAWMEYFTELMHARSYAMLYPSLLSGQKLVVVHDGFEHPPEEFDTATGLIEDKRGVAGAEKDDTFIAPAAPPEQGVVSHGKQGVVTGGGISLHQILPFNGFLPALDHLPLLDTSGVVLSRERADARAEAYTAKFRELLGGCGTDPLAIKMAKQKRERVIVEGSARDLFCWGTEYEHSDYEEAESASAGEKYVYGNYRGARTPHRPLKHHVPVDVEGDESDGGESFGDGGESEPARGGGGAHALKGHASGRTEDKSAAGKDETEDDEDGDADKAGADKEDNEEDDGNEGDDEQVNEKSREIGGQVTTVTGESGDAEEEDDVDGGEEDEREEDDGVSSPTAKPPIAGGAAPRNGARADVESPEVKKHVHGAAPLAHVRGG